MPGDISKSFEDNLKDQKKYYGLRSNLARIVVAKRNFNVVDLDKIKVIFSELENMNINDAVIYPDLAGFSKALKTRLSYFEKCFQKVNV